MSAGLKLEDIAQLAGVSRSTVSRVINQDPHVSPATRRKVLRVIGEQNFRPNLVARALVTRRTQTVSLVIPQGIGSVFADPYFPILIQGAILEANRRGYATMLWIGDGVEEEASLCQRVLDNNFFDGVIVASAIDHDPLLPRLIAVNFPFVLIGPPQIDSLNYVDVDNITGAQAAVAHLISLGRNRIGAITGPLNMGAAQDRLTGYRQALQAAGKPSDANLIVEGRFDRASGYDQMQKLLQRQVDAVFVASDLMALGALQAIHESGRRVPEDIAVIGFDDLPVADDANPPLTTVRQPIAQLGNQSIRMLIGLLEGEFTAPCQQRLPTQLIIRQSCGSAAGMANPAAENRTQRVLHLPA